MKTFSKTVVLFFALNAMVWITPQKTAAQASINFQIFYDNLSPFGDWVYNPDYGYVWFPDVSYGFAPYSTNGYWTFTNAGWTWISNYSWGWAPFHYGRWLYDNYYGWLWIPGEEWGPGWVTWRRAEGYYGWAPIGPSISISFAYSSDYRLPYNHWTFVRDQDFGRTNINNYYINSSSNTTIIRNSTVINSTQADNSNRVRNYSGPNRTEVQILTGKSFAPVVVSERDNPGQNIGKGKLQIYRPRVEKNNSAEQKLTPKKVSNREDLKSENQRKTNAKLQQENKQSNNQMVQQKPDQQQRNNQQSKQQQEQQRNVQPAKQSNNPQTKKQQVQQLHNNQQAQQQQEQQQRNNQQAKEQQEQQQKNNPQAQQQQTKKEQDKKKKKNN